MKKDVHPKYNNTTTFACECGNNVVAGSTLESYKVEICSACHPFYTGKQKLVDSAGRVEKFKAKQAAAKGETKDNKISDTAKKLKKDEKYMTIDKIKSIKEKEEAKAEKREAKKTGEAKAKAKTPAKKVAAKTKAKAKKEDK